MENYNQLQDRYIQIFHLLPRPGCLAQEFEAGVDARVLVKAVDAHPFTHILPAVLLHKVVEYHLQRLAV